ncbi:hypothetical protein SAMN05216339_101420 [Nitrosomonas eutropha]|uniref:Uncharacterized protein n=1 Tax=Nitrosomonas eutropha TaxID=916 RepID=A0A1I7FCP7_9PROT|nr:hypothetical protein [Nitrosomonas eutropha]SFU33980.1 hypothetical protein SAMN05216339_101420 [Nitrosomonas eutropha]
MKRLLEHSTEKKDQKFTDRAKLRLRLAAGLIGGQGRTLKLDRANFYPEMLEVIERQTPEQREYIKSLVDWLEDYENAVKAEEPRIQAPKK